jgi:tetratricopeptide (TPR) repeat protein
MKIRLAVTAAVLVSYAALCASPASAQVNASGNAYDEPKVKLGKGDPSIAVAGKGTVVVQVFVKADGTAKVQRVIRSTNPGDNAAAIAIANSSTYTPAMRAGKPVDAFKDFTISFAAGGGASSGAGSEGATGGLTQAETMLRAGNYNGSRDAATAYVGQHPDSGEGYAVLGASQTFLNNYSAAAAAFDKAGKLPEKYVPVAAQAYIGNANALEKDGKSTDAVAAAKKAVALQPSVATYNALGIHELSAKDPASAVRDLEQADKLAAADSKIPANVHATVLANLASAYAANGQMDKAKTTVDAAVKLDPGNKAGDGIANILAQQAESLESQKKFADAGAAFESAAQFSPSNASVFYLRASISYLSEQPKPDPAKARDAANKSLAANPNNANANYTLGVALAELGQKDDARAALQKALTQAKAANETALADKIQAAIKQIDGKS